MRNFDYMDDSEESARCLVDDGICLNYGPLSLCKIRRIIGDSYQLDSMWYAVPYSNLFIDFSLAFSKFKELKQSLKNTGYKERKNADRRPTIFKNE